MARMFLNNFTSGMWTRLVSARVDYERYNSACRKLVNFEVMPYGGARFRRGTVLRHYDSSRAVSTAPPALVASGGGGGNG